MRQIGQQIMRLFNTITPLSASFEVVIVSENCAQLGDVAVSTYRPAGNKTVPVVSARIVSR